VSRYCEKQKVKLPTLKRVLTAGAPVPRHILERVRKCIADDAEVHTPYGATESLPVACTESREVLEGTWVKTQAGEGICVGRRWPQIRWQIIAISDGPIEQIENAQVLPAGQIGELIVSGPVVTDQYVTRVAANALHKIIDGERFWHRMGDVGYLDDDDRFWFCGRKGHRVQTANGILFTIPCEAIYNNHPQIYRSALVGVGVPGKQIPMIIAEPWPENWTAEHAAQRQLIQQLKDLGERSPLTSQIQEIRLMRALPVDIRHNSKIFREKLAVWAEKQLRTAK
jgi:acyl-coenzyme A synthetase/AMP-(fatty) acid ligase